MSGRRAGVRGLRCVWQECRHLRLEMRMVTVLVYEVASNSCAHEEER